MLLILAQTPPSSDFVGWLLIGMGALFSAMIGMATWYARVEKPAIDQRFQTMSENHATRLDSKDAAHDVAVLKIVEAHGETVLTMQAECKQERAEIREAVKLDGIETRKALEGLTAAVSRIGRA